MFAKMMILLPSKFTGGAAHLTHSGLTAIQDCSEDNVFQTTILSWFTEVTQEIKPITSGFRLALSYSIGNSDTTAPQPTLSTNQRELQQLREVFNSWKNFAAKKSPAPEKISFLLANKYTEQDLRKGLSCLRGTDAHKVSTVDLLTKQLGFSTSLVNLVYSLDGIADISGCQYGRRRNRGYGYYDMYDIYGDDDDDDSDYENSMPFEKVKEREVSVELMVDMNGKELAHELDMSDATLTKEGIPSNIPEEVESSLHDSQEYDGDDVNGYRFVRSLGILVQIAFTDMSKCF